ncbi:MAG TPA: enoyl-CoA hydratase [Polyangiaceae bacterium]|nr:enoyl-CoA hydratase [Polyangiaceae bacterium]
MDIQVEDVLGGKARRVVFNRPHKKNALTGAMYASLSDALAEAAAHRDVRAVVIAGNGPAFTAGNDLHDFMEAAPGEDSSVLRFLQALVTFPKPLVAAVGGAAIGVGTTMLLHCDLVIAAASAKFQLPFVNLGLCPEGGSSLLLPSAAGLQLASDALLWGDPFGAADAHRMRIVNEVVPDTELSARVVARLERIVALPPDAVAATKALLRQPIREELERAMGREVAVFRERLTSPEAAEAFTAFFEKRPPRFG